MWKVTRETVEQVLVKNNLNSSMATTNDEWNEYVDECFTAINIDTVKREASYGCNMPEQIDYANLSIYEQLVEAGKI